MKRKLLHFCSILALSLANAIAGKNSGLVTALFVEPAVGTDAEQVGRRIVDRVISKAVGDNRERITSKVVIADRVLDGIQSAAQEGCDLILAGATYENAVRRMLSLSRPFSPIASWLEERAPSR